MVGAHSLPAGREVKHLGEGAGSNTREVSTINDDTNYDTEVRSARVAQAKAAVDMATSPAVSEGTSQVFTPQFYQRLPHPLSHLLKDLNVVDGADANLLCDFFVEGTQNTASGADD